MWAKIFLIVSFDVFVLRFSFELLHPFEYFVMCKGAFD